MAGILAQLPRSFAQLFTQVREGSMSGSVILLVFGGAIIIIAFISFMELAQRRVLVQYPKRATQRGMQADRSNLPLKVNTSGVIPPIFASSLKIGGASGRERVSQYASMSVVAGPVKKKKITRADKQG